MTRSSSAAFCWIGGLWLELLQMLKNAGDQIACAHLRRPVANGVSRACPQKRQTQVAPPEQDHRPIGGTVKHAKAAISRAPEPRYEGRDEMGVKRRRPARAINGDAENEKCLQHLKLNKVNAHRDITQK